MFLSRCLPSAFLHRTLIFVVGISILTSQAFTLHAAPNRLDCRGVTITAPIEGATLTGAVEIRGQAQVSNFQFYKVEYSLAESERWVLIGVDVIRSPVQNGLLVTWQTASVPEGEYRLRLRAVDVTGNYCEVVLGPLHVSRVRPTETVPEPTETAILTSVTGPPQPTFTPSFKPTVEVAPIVSQPGAIPTRVQTLTLPEVNSSGLVTFFISGVLVMLAVMLAAGLWLFVRRWR